MITVSTGHDYLFPKAVYIGAYVLGSWTIGFPAASQIIRDSRKSGFEESQGSPATEPENIKK
jgi:hypothetical protein